MKLIVALDNNYGIGKNDKIPWHCNEDLKYFSKLTRGEGNNCVIMGRKTYESIGCELKNRKNIVLSKTKTIESSSDNLIIFDNIDKINVYLNHNKFDSVWIIGGESIYREYLNRELINEIYITNIVGNYDCDSFFPNEFIHVFNEDINYKVPSKEGIIYKKYVLSV
jgi:dihydrofolate reductase